MVDSVLLSSSLLLLSLFFLAISVVRLTLGSIIPFGSIWILRLDRLAVCSTKILSRFLSRQRASSSVLRTGEKTAIQTDDNNRRTSHTQTNDDAHPITQWPRPLGHPADGRISSSTTPFRVMAMGLLRLGMGMAARRDRQQTCWVSVNKARGSCREGWLRQNHNDWLCLFLDDCGHGHSISREALGLCL